MAKILRLTFARAALVTLLAACSLALAACSAEEDDSGQLTVVASTAILADLAAAVAGDDAAVSALIPAGVDLHAYQPSPETARRVARADVLLLNGYGLEEQLLDLIAKNRGDDAVVVVAAAGLEPRAGGDDHGDDHGADDHDNDGAASRDGIDAAAFAHADPHFWLAVPNARHYVERIRDALAAADPDHAPGYRARAAAYIEQLTALDAELRATVAAIPESRRKLIVFHGAFGYFADAYGLRIVAAVLPGGANQQPSAGVVAELVRAVRREGVPAVYAEPQFSSPVLDAVAREAGVRVLTLYSDTFAGDVQSYLELMRANARALAAGLGGA